MMEAMQVGAFTSLLGQSLSEQLELCKTQLEAQPKGKTARHSLRL